MGYKKLTTIICFLVILISSIIVYSYSIAPRLEFKKQTNAYFYDLQLCPAKENQDLLITGFNIYTKEAAQNNPEAEYLLGLAYLGALGTYQDISKGTQLIQEAANNNYAPAQSMYGYLLEYDQHKPQEAMSWYLKAAQQHDPYGNFSLAFEYFNGNHKALTANDYMKYLTQAEAFPAAQYLLGLSYASGLVFPKDQKKAIYWFTKAFNNKNLSNNYRSSSAHELGMIYWEYPNLDKDHKKSNYWFKAANAIIIQGC